MMEISGNHNDNVLNLVTVSYSYSDYSFLFNFIILSMSTIFDLTLIFFIIFIVIKFNNNI